MNPIARLAVMLIGIIAVSPCQASAQDDAPLSPEDRVRAYVAAFNAYDTEAMMAMVTDDVQWLSVQGDAITEEAGNRQQLRESMESYFRSCSDCQAKLSHLFATGERVSALELAVTSGQQSLSVYEFADGLIRRVYYFPAEKTP